MTERAETSGTAFWADADESEALQRYRTLVNTAGDGIYQLDAEDRFVAVNDGITEITGYAREDLLGEHVSVLLWDDSSALEREVERPGTNPSARSEPLECTLQSADGERIRCEVRTNPLEADGIGRGIVGIVRDLTERNRTELATSERDQRGEHERTAERERELTKYETIVETVNDGIYVKDASGYFTMVNDAYAELTGYDREELVGAHASLVVDEGTIQQSREMRTEATGEDDSNPAMEATIQTADGDAVPAEGTFSTLQTGEDEEQQVGVVRDITERVERERELERALDLLEKTERIADVGGWELDTETMDVFWTDHVFELLGVDADEEPPLDEALDMYHEDDRQNVETAIEQALDSGDPFDVEARIRTTSGERRWLRLQGVPETVGDDVVSLRGAAQDVTERRQREQRLEQFAYAASHDLQEPLRMVSSYLQLLEQRYEDALDEDGREFIEFAVDGADRMRAMIEGLLEYSRVGTRGDSFEPVDLNAVLEDVRDDLQVTIEESDAEVTAEELPRIEGDDGQLRQLFQNLLDNAIEYSGDDPPRVHVDAKRNGSKWLISVTDEGIGIDPEDSDRIFEVFQSLHSPDDHSGTGIGLALCERIVERHGGDIWVDSDPGEGSTFSFTLPEAGDRDA